MNNKKVYIIIPVYNVENYLRKCLDSVFNQTYKNIQVVCINDGSTDNSLSILKEYSVYSNFTIISQANKGVSAARNAGLDSLNYNEDAYLAFVDADDWVEVDYVQKLIGFLEINKVDIVCSSFFMANERTNKIFNQTDKDLVLPSLEATKMLLKDESLQSHSHTKLFKLSIWKDIRFDEELFYMEDQSTLFRSFYVSNSVYITNYSGYYYRQDNKESITKLNISTSKVISGLKGYFAPCNYVFKDKDREYLFPSIHTALANAFLMLIPYYKKKEATKEDVIFIKNLKKYIRKEKLIFKFIPNNRNNKIKKIIYLACPRFYSIVFRFAKKLHIFHCNKKATNNSSL